MGPAQMGSEQMSNKTIAPSSNFRANDMLIAAVTFRNWSDYKLYR